MSTATLTPYDQFIAETAARVRPQPKGQTFAAAPQTDPGDEPMEFGGLNHPGAWSQFETPRVRSEFESRHARRYRRDLLAAVRAKGPLPTADVAVPAAKATLRLFGRSAGLGGLTALTSALPGHVAGDRRELEELTHQQNDLENAYGNEASGVSYEEFHRQLAPILARKATVEARLPYREKALAGFADALPKRLAAVIDVEDTVTRLYEARVVANDVPALDGRIFAAEAELASVVEHLERLSSAGNRIQPGAIASGLESRRVELLGKIQELRQASADRIASGIRREVQDAVSGNLAAVAELVSSIRANAPMFAPGLDVAIVDAVSGAMSDADPITWSYLLESLTTRSKTPARDAF